jgi:hypothetical protein
MVPLVRILLPLLAAVTLGAATQPQTPGPVLSAQDHHDLRCAAALAVVAVMQTRGEAAAIALPPLGIRGKRYFGLVGERIAAQSGLSGEAMHDILADAARSVAHEGAPAVARSCLGELDAAVPQRPAPDAVACLAMLEVYADVLAARNANDALIATLRREAMALAPAAHALLQARGLDAAREADTLEREHARVREALTGGPAIVDADDFAQCRRLNAGRPAPR